jgi:hypothetical protein
VSVARSRPPSRADGASDSDSANCDPPQPPSNPEDHRALWSGGRRIQVQVKMRILGYGALASTCLVGLVLALGIGTVAEAHPPASHDHAKSPVRVEVFGDSTALSLGWGLAATSLTSRYNYTSQNMGVLGCGLVNGPVVRFMGTYYLDHTECNGAPPRPGEPLSAQPWPVQWKAAMSTNHPNVAVILAGRWEIVDRVYNGAWTNILDPMFAHYVKQQLELASNLVTSTGANVVFLTSPCANEMTQPDGTAYPESNPYRLAIYNNLVREVAAEHPKTDSVIDLGALVCPGGKFKPTYKGVQIRTPDGIHFTELAGVVLGPALMPKILASGRAAIARVGSVAHHHPSG